MKRILIFLWIFLLTTPLLMASQMYVVGEVFTQTWCGYCPAARSALRQMHNNPGQFPYFIPIIWQGNGPHVSPNYSGRASLYGVGGIPHAQWGGTIPVIGGGTTTYNAYVNAHNQIVGINSPLEIDLDLSVNDQNQLVMTAETLLTGNITTTNNVIQFILTYDLTGVMDPDYFASVKTYYQETFPLTSQGQQGVYSHAVNIDPTWDLYNVTAVAIVQTMAGNRAIHQAAKAQFMGLMPIFFSNIQQGPPSLHVQFYDNSLPAQNIESWEWDLNGDGIFDSTEQNPTFVYTEPGSYDVTLRISDGEDFEELTVEGFVTVTDPSDISGHVGGTWSPDHGTYHITGDVVVPADSYLIIEPGVEIIINGSSITVNGQIIANAEDADPIIFTADIDRDGTWKGLRIINSQEPHLLNNCIFSHANQTALIVDNSHVNIIGNTFFSNSGVADPGGVKITSSNELTFKNNVFANNVSTNGVAALEINASSFDVTNNLFVNNAGHVSSAFAVKTGSAVMFFNNTVANNHVTSATGFHILNFNSFLQIRNSIIRGQTPIISQFANSVTNVDYTNISGGNSGAGNIDENPLFVDPTEGAGIQYNGLDAVWYLSDGSPCIDAGNPAAAYNDPEDPNNPGYARFPAKGTVVNDMGAYGGSGIDYWLSIDGEVIIPTPLEKMRIVAYPNPFNPDLTISLSQLNLPPEQPVTLKIYNARGQLVKTLLENRVSDSREYLWNGLDNSNRPVTTGMYFIQVTSGDINVNHKVILLK